MAKKSELTDVNLNVKPAVLMAEFVGTFILTIAVLASINGVLPIAVPTPLVAGIALALMVLAIGGISGSHINPAVTIGMWSTKRINAGNAVAYIVAQIAGALSAFGVMSLMLNGNVTLITSSASDWYVFAAEAVGAAVFTFGIAAAVQQGFEGVNAALLVGGSLFLGIFIALVVSNGVLNPAVAIAIDSASWAYILAPAVGAIVGMNLEMWIRNSNK